MSDTSTQTGAEGAITDAGTDTGTGATTENEPSGEGWDDNTRTYVEKLRRENAGHRTKAKELETQLSEYNDVFGNIPAEDRQVWLGMAREMYRDPKAGAEWMAKVAAGVQAGLTQEQAEAAAGSEPTAKPEGEQGPGEKPLTKAELEQWYKDQREAEKVQEAQEAAIRSIESEAKDLGYEDGTAEYNNLLWLALNKTSGDMQKAHEMLEAQKQQVIDDYIAGKAQQGRGHRSRPPADALPTNIPGRPVEIKTLADSHKAAAARIRGVLGAR